MPLTTSPSPSQSTPWWWCDLVDVHELARPRSRASEPSVSIDVVLGAFEGAEHAAVLVVAERSGRCWTSVPPQRDVDQLHPAADAEHRQVALDRRARERDFEAVALGHRVDRLRVGARAVGGRVDVGAAGEDQPVEQREHLGGLLGQLLVGRRASPPARRRAGRRAT